MNRDQMRTIGGLMGDLSDYALRALADPRNARDVQELAANELLVRRTLGRGSGSSRRESANENLARNADAVGNNVDADAAQAASSEDNERREV